MYGLYVAPMTKTAKDSAPATPSAGFINEPEFLRRIPICRRTAANLRKAGKLPYVKLGKRVLYHWETVQSALLRQSKGTLS